MAVLNSAITRIRFRNRLFIHNKFLTEKTMKEKSRYDLQAVNVVKLSRYREAFVKHQKIRGFKLIKTCIRIRIGAVV